ncbi:MAG: hypothetical protein KKA79_06895 [Nanoarchaeota archaeon]|nr:hypothetical protein [Nanoarchaeota archaeon]MCG2718892.1 hypothetical protein [Nanoarchaeota archaeon]
MLQIEYQKKSDSEAFNTVNKAFVRERWIFYAKERLKRTGHTYIRLFTLPGVDCRDVGLFVEHGLLYIGKIGFINDTLAFAEKIPERYIRIKNALPNSRGFKGTYQYFVGRRSIGFSPQAEKWFPFDVINLDFTGPGFLHTNDYKTSSIMYSIKKTFEAQKLKRQSFTLFLTLTAEEKMDTEEGKTELMNCIRENKERFADFKIKYEEMFDDDNFGTYQRFISFGVSKVIIKWGAENQFDVNEKECCTYTGGGSKRNKMVSFIFECEYIGLPDGYGGTLTSMDKVYVERIRSILNLELEIVESILSKDKKLKEKLEQETQKVPYSFKPC